MKDACYNSQHNIQCKIEEKNCKFKWVCRKYKRMVKRCAKLIILSKKKHLKYWCRENCIECTAKRRDIDNTILGIVEGTQSNWRCHDDCSKFCYADGYVSSDYIKKFSKHEMELFLIDKVNDDQNWVENKNSKGEFVKKDKDILSTDYVTN